MTGLALCLVLTGAARAEPTLAVRVSGFERPVGDAIVAVFGPEDDWLDLDHPTARAVLPVLGGEVSCVFEGLAPGRWAVAVVHDLDGDGHLDMRWFPWPKLLEAVGMSNDPQSSLGPPSFSAAAFDLAAEGRNIHVHMRQVEGRAP
ncbi:MAG: DUF2141 domain-containing protein [Pseudomonadota bacterium]